MRQPAGAFADHDDDAKAKATSSNADEARGRSTMFALTTCRTNSERNGFSTPPEKCTSAASARQSITIWPAKCVSHGAPQLLPRSVSAVLYEANAASTVQSAGTDSAGRIAMNGPVTPSTSATPTMAIQRRPTSHRKTASPGSEPDSGATPQREIASRSVRPAVAIGALAGISRRRVPPAIGAIKSRPSRCDRGLRSRPNRQDHSPGREAPSGPGHPPARSQQGAAQPLRV